MSQITGLAQEQVFRTAWIYGNAEAPFIGWTMGVVVSAVGVWLSFRLDLPTGAAIVATFGAALLILAAIRRFVPGPWRTASA